MKSRPATSRTRISSARTAAFDILLRVERESSYASELLHSPASNQLSSADHALCTELVMGVLRWRSVLDSRIACHSAHALSKLDLEVLISLRMAAYQLGWLDRVPPRAAIHESVELVKRAHKASAAAFANAVLRKIADAHVANSRAPMEGGSVETLAAETAHPRWMVERWIHAYGIDATRKICAHDQSIPDTTVRLRGERAEMILQDEGIELAPGAWLASARRILRGDVSRTTAFRQGLCVIQDEASQLVAALVGSGARMLDCCAAPGGKTLAIADRNPHARITAVELHPHRARLLKKLMSQGKENTGSSAMIRYIAADARKLPLAEEFDRVLVDVPCTGTGTLARNPEIKWRIKQADFDDLQSRQIAILQAALARVSSGGRVIYSTCSLEKEENEDVIEHVLPANPAFHLVDCDRELERLKREEQLVWNGGAAITRGPFLRTIPGVHPCDGFFAAILEKNQVDRETA